MCVLFHDISISVCFFQQFRNECKLMNKLVETHLERIQMLMRICWQWKPDQSHCHQALKPETLMGRWEGRPEQFLMDKKNIIYHNGPVPFFLSFFLSLSVPTITDNHLQLTMTMIFNKILKNELHYMYAMLYLNTIWILNADWSIQYSCYAKKHTITSAMTWSSFFFLPLPILTT